MRKKIFLYGIAVVLLALLLKVHADDKYITYNETFTHLGPDGGDPEYVFAEFIENRSLHSVSQKFSTGTIEFFEPIIYFSNNEYQIDVEEIYNNVEYKIKLFRNRVNRKKSKTKPYVPNPNPETIIVDINGTGDYTTIQEGIDNASDGDIILVYPGTYYENIDYDGKNITVRSKYYATGDELYINNTIIDGNRTGSVVSLFNGETDADICGFTIQNGKSINEFYDGGGIYLDEVTISISDCIIQKNEASSGGGIMSYPSSNIFLENVTIRNNYAHTAGGGIYLSGESTLYFAENSRCNIFMNYSPIGSDICTNYFGDLEIIVDTFTVDNPDKFYVYSITDDAFTYDVLNHKIYTINQDVYITPYGNNENSGLSWSEAFKNIYHALIMVRSDSTHPNTIYVDEGTYSPSTTGEFFALKGKEYISIIGAGKELTILDAEQTGRLFTINNIDKFRIEDITLQHGYDESVGCMHIKNSDPIIKNVIIVNNNISGELGRVHIHCNNNSCPIFENVTITSEFIINSKAMDCAS